MSGPEPKAPPATPLIGTTLIHGPPPVRTMSPPQAKAPVTTKTAQPKRLMSAQEALQAAIASEGSLERAPGDAPHTEQAPSPSREPGQIVLDLIPGAHIHRTLTVSNPDVFSALWRAHQVRAAHEGSLAVVGLASALLHAVQELPSGKLTAVHLEHQGQSYAAWVNTVTGTLLGIVEPAELYLAGL